MGFFSDIRDKIFGHHEEAVTRTAQAQPAPSPVGNKPAAAPVAPDPVAPTPVTPTATPTASAPATAPADVDVTAILDKAVADSGQTLDWRKSIVDLMKALGIDSSLSARKELAQELNYSGDTSDSAAMNIWLHKAVIQKLADNGGKVPADLL